MLAIPLFILSLTFLSTVGIANRIINFVIDCVGWIRGGLAMASVLACMIFATGWTQPVCSRRHYRRNIIWVLITYIPQILLWLPEYINHLKG